MAAKTIARRSTESHANATGKLASLVADETKRRSSLRIRTRNSYSNESENSEINWQHQLISERTGLSRCEFVSKELSLSSARFGSCARASACASASSTASASASANASGATNLNNCVSDFSTSSESFSTDCVCKHTSSSNQISERNNNHNKHTNSNNNNNTNSSSNNNNDDDDECTDTKGGTCCYAILTKNALLSTDCALTGDLPVIERALNETTSNKLGTSVKDNTAPDIGNCEIEVDKNSTDSASISDDSESFVMIMGSNIANSLTAAENATGVRKTIVGSTSNVTPSATATTKTATTTTTAATTTSITTNATATATAATTTAQQQTQDSSTTTQTTKCSPTLLPNNTLIEDLSKCHRNVTDLWPRATQATLTTVGAFRACWAPTLLRKPTDLSDPTDTTTIKESSEQQQQQQSTKLQKPLKFHMPDSLNRLNTTLKEEEYDKALDTLTNDVRYQLHLTLYRRLDTIWTLLSTVLCILVPTLLANFELPVLLGAGALWIVSIAFGALVINRTRKNLDLMLERSVAQANSFFMDHNLMIGVINVGGLLSKTKLIVPILYFDTSQCREQIESIIWADAQRLAPNDKRVLDYSKIGLPLTDNMMALAQSQLAKKIVLRHIQRWISYFDRQKLIFTDDQMKPRHLSTGKCLCQFIEEHFKNSENLSNLNNFDLGNLRYETSVAQAIDFSSDSLRAADSTNTKKKSRKTLATFLRSKSNKNNEQITIVQGQQDPSPNMAHVSLKNQQQEAPVSYARNNLYIDTASMPTLSGLVSMKNDISAKRDIYSNNVDRLDGSLTSLSQSKTPFVISGDLKLPQQLCGLNARTSATSPAHNKIDLGEERLDDTGNITKRNSLNLNDADLSLEMDGELIGRSDELVRKLRLLLEIRKDDLRGLDGSTLFANALYKVPQQHLFYPPEDSSSSMENNAHTTIEMPDDSGCEPPNMKTKNLRKFFGQGESTFNFGFKKSQKDTNMSQTLEIF